MKFNFVVDQKLFWGFVGMFEGIFFQNINYVCYQNFQFKFFNCSFIGVGLDNCFFFSGVFVGFGDDVVDLIYIGIYLVSNIDEGYSYNFVVSFIKFFDRGFSGMFFYFYGDVFFVFDGIFFQNSFQWCGYYNL